MDAPAGRHFYGHGTFSRDGTVLYTTENDYEAARGVIGLWDTDADYRRMGEIASGGIGPHDVLRLPGSDTLVVANGGIETHPDTGRVKLNLPLMRPNLTYLAPDGPVLDQMELGPDLHQNSIRHLDVTPSGEVAFAMQWQGPESAHPSLLGLHSQGGTARLLAAPAALHRQLQGYAGSVAFSRDGTQVAITSPRGGTVQVFSATKGAHRVSLDVTDGCGISRGTTTAFQITSGSGAYGPWNGAPHWTPHRAARAFDNHLIVLNGSRTQRTE